ncbi:hypothetical protein ABZT49_06945, partial [Methylobacterium sp. EM32]|uniref:hypothetical protein n=1 Tax=Methylobacterium sp. EM32 TaxID=3163481 RepID=UPI0033B3094F
RNSAGYGGRVLGMAKTPHAKAFSVSTEPGQSQAPAVPAPAHPVVGLQHPLALYDGLSGLMTGEPA